MNWFDALLWGFVATVVMETVMAGSQGIGWSRISMPFLLGTILTPDRNRAYALGLAVHFVNGWVIALGYAAIFENLNSATALAGALLGALQGLFVLTAVLPFIPGVHPRMATEGHGPHSSRGLQPPGFMARNYGWRTPLVTMAAHILYGLVLGVFYVPHV